MSAEIEWIGLRAWRSAMQRAPGLIKINARRVLPEIGVGIIGAAKGWIRGRRTDPRTRKRTDTSLILGSFSGRLESSIRQTKLRTWSTGYVLEVGPTGRAEEYAFLHELGAGPWPARPFLARALIDEESSIYNLLGRKIFVKVG